MRILIIGATGMLGQALMDEARLRKIEAVGLARSNADLEVDICDEAGLRAAIKGVQADMVINAAALVDLGQCENDEDYAHHVNAVAVGVMAEACLDCEARFVQISTDHFYAGDGDVLHDEEAPVTLLNAYARSKFYGEKLALKDKNTLVVRTNISGFRGIKGHPTFIEWVIGVLQAGECIHAFEDFFTSTIDTRSFATALFDLIEVDAHGILNVASHQVVHKRMFIEAVARTLGLTNTNIQSASLRELKPRRGDSLGLDVSKAEKLLGRKLPMMEDIVRSLVEEFKRQS